MVNRYKKRTDIKIVRTSKIVEGISETIKVLNLIQTDDDIIIAVDKVATLCINAIQSGHKVIFIGNGGSAADAQHLAAEFVSRFSFDRPGLPAIALTTDTSVITSIGNDYGYDVLFKRQIEAIGNAGDILIAISTSGRSKNILTGLKAAREKGLSTVGFTSTKGFEMAPLCDCSVNVPATTTANIQEAHITLGHIICGLVEQELFGRECL